MLRVNGKFNISGEVACGDKSISHRGIDTCVHCRRKQRHTQSVRLPRRFVYGKVSARARRRDKYRKRRCVRNFLKKKKKRFCMVAKKDKGKNRRRVAGGVGGGGEKKKFTGEKTLKKRGRKSFKNPGKKWAQSLNVIKTGCSKAAGKSLGSEIVAEVNSAQVKSAVLIAGLFAAGVTVYCENTTYA